MTSLKILDMTRNWKVECIMCPAENLCCTTYCTIDAGQQLAIELHHGIYSSFHLLLSHGLQLSCRKKKLSVSHSVFSAHIQTVTSSMSTDAYTSRPRMTCEKVRVCMWGIQEKKCGIRKLQRGLLKSMQCTLGRTVGEKEGSMNKNEGDSEKSGERTNSDNKKAIIK